MNNEKVLNFITTNKAVTTIDEIIANMSDVKADELNTPGILQALEQNKIMMKLMLKTKLFKNDTTQSIIELNKIIDNETNNKQVSDFIDNVAEQWKSNELL